MTSIISSSDIRYTIFKSILNKKFIAAIIADSEGVLAGVEEAIIMANKIGVEVLEYKASGGYVTKGENILLLRGNPVEIAVAEDTLIGLIAKPSGIATAARKASRYAKEKGVRVVCGAWKKMPIEVKNLFRKAIQIGGIGIRIVDKPFIYLDKNYVRMFGGIKNALEAIKNIEDRVKVIQIRGEFKDVVSEAIEASRYGADIIMVDTGNVEDLKNVHKALISYNIRKNVMLAFGGNVKINDIPIVADAGADIIDIGKEIIDAPLLDLKLEVLKES